MTKSQAIADPNSCWNRAGNDEPVFVLLGRDVASPDTIVAWIQKRIEKKKNGWADVQIANALTDVDEMAEYSKLLEDRKVIK